MLKGTKRFRGWTKLSIFLSILLPLALLYSPVQASFQRPVQLSDDLFLAPDVPRILSGSEPGYYETSEYMVGKVAVGVVFLESSGKVDPSTKDWTQEEELVKDEILTALSWWASQNPSANLTFKVEWHLRVLTSYEPISRPSSDEGLWISEAMNRLGYYNTSYFSQVRDFVNDLRSRLKTDWCFAIFVVDSSNDEDGRFADGLIAYAYLGGPFLVLNYKLDGFGPQKMDLVAAHEVAHIFYATDEYDGVTEYSGYLNASDVEGSGALMDSGERATLSLSEGTKLQIGWRDSDNDGILDVVDTSPRLTLEKLPPDLTDLESLSYEGRVEDVPYPNKNPYGSGRSVTINKIKSVKFRIDEGP